MIPLTTLLTNHPYQPTFTQEELDDLQAARDVRRREWHEKVVYLNDQIETGKVKIPLDYPFIRSLAAVKTDVDGLVDLRTLDSTAKAFANAVWDAQKES